MEDYVTRDHCDYRHKEVMDKLTEVLTEQRDTNKRLYKDNGRKSVQTILSEHGQVIKVIIWVAGGAALAAITSLVGQAIRGFATG